MFVVLLIFVLITDVFGYYLADLILPPNPHIELENTYEKCLSTRKILYDGQCWDLLTKGPCDEGQWLVLNWNDEEDEQRDERPLTAKCTKRRCSKSDTYWPWDGFCYTAETAERRRLCPSSDTNLTTDEFGDGYCECRTGGHAPYVRVFSADDDEDSRPCYPVYSKGPCPHGHVLTPHEWGYGNCTVDQCATERDSSSSYVRQQQKQRQPMQKQQQQMQQQQQQQPSSAMAPWSDGRCYELGTQGPCASNEKFAVIRYVMRPGCVKKATELDLFSNKKSTAAAAAITAEPSPPPCKTDHRGACVDAVDVQEDDPTYGFKAQLLESARRHAKRNRKKKKRTP